MTSQPTDIDRLQTAGELSKRTLALYLLAAGVAVHLVAWGLPTYDEWRGYQAYTFCFSWVLKLMLEPREASLLTVLGAVGPHSNYLVVAAVVAILRKSSISALGWIMWLLLGSLLCNLCWLFDKDSVSHLRAGYFLWLLSFLLIAGAVALMRKAIRA